ncbi:hypothetical protein F4212_04930 [Candidatus Poribacteria bacterium]|nr:hypothetical protein [Candidatus Poribacteria bacterium]
MFLNPTTTCLILLGASSFSNYNDHDRKSFSRAHDAIKQYFLRSHVGLDLLPENVHDLFNSELSATAQIDAAAQFVRNNTMFRDVFVYIVTHGTFFDNRYLLKVRNSSDKPDGSIRDDTHIGFDALYQEIFGAGSMRLYFIVDACDSGAIHTPHKDQVLLPLAPPENQFETEGRGASAVFLTANSQSNIGLVYGADDNEFPLFTGCLLETLEGGVQEGFSYGLSFDTLRYIINKHCQERTRDLEVPVSNIAQVSDRSNRPYSDEEFLLSSFTVFPNNDQANVRFNKVAHKVRKSFRDSTRDKNIRKLTEIENNRLKAENKDLKTANKLLTDNLTKEKEITIQLNTSVKGLDRSNRRLLWCLGVAVALPLLFCVIIFIGGPDVQEMLVEAIGMLLPEQQAGSGS